jgi:hypothetical protein
VGEGAGPDQAAAERRFRFELAAHPGSPAQARRLARARLTGWSVCEDTCDTADLVISELVTNAIVHTASGIVVCELYDGGDLVRIAVRDEGCAPGEPHPSPQRPEEEHGRGLFLVDALCQAWGAQENGPGLLVWADLARGGEHGVRAEAGPGDHAEVLDALTGCHADAVSEDGVPETRVGPGVPRNDLGWGARPKPGPADGSGDEDDAAEHADHGDHGDHAEQEHAEQGHRSTAAEGRIPAPAHRALAAGEPLPQVAPQLPHVAPQLPHLSTQMPHLATQMPHVPPQPPHVLPQLPNVPPQRHHGQETRSRATGTPAAGPADDFPWSTDHALDTAPKTPSWRPHSGTGRNLDRDPA